MRPLHMFFALLVAAIWGANFVASKYALAYFPPFFVTFLRFLIVGALLIFIVKKPTRKQMQHIAWLSLVLVVMHFSFLQAALAAKLDIASCAILSQLGVPFSCMLGVFFMGDKLGKWRLLGLIIAFAGMVVVLGTPNVNDHWTGATFALAAAFFWGVANLLMKRHAGIDVFQMLCWMALLASPQLLLISFMFESPSLSLIQHVPLGVALSMAFTVFFSTFMGYGLWYYLMKLYPMSHVAPFSLLTPVFGIYFGQLLFSESLNSTMLLGGLATLIGVGIIVIRRPKMVAVGKAI